MKAWCVVLAAVCASGCISAHTERMADVDPEGWDRLEPATVTWQNDDTVSLRDIRLLVRHDGRPCGRTVTFDIEVTTPDTVCYSEPFTARICGQAPDNECVIPYRRDVLLSRKGTYTFRIGTAAGGIKGIAAVGIGMEPAGKNTTEQDHGKR